MSPTIYACAAMAGHKSQAARQPADAYFYQFVTSQNVQPNCSLIKNVRRGDGNLLPLRLKTY